MRARRYEKEITSMRAQVLAYLALLSTAAVPVFAEPAATVAPSELPPGVNPETGARPGNEIGTGKSLPFSDKASNITPENTRSVIAPNLPAPPVGHPATPLDYLVAARIALNEGHTGEAQEALERAETRALDRSLPLREADQPIIDPLVAKIREARYALADNDIPRALQLVTSASQTAEHLAYTW
jgi:hypothetical protein